MVLICYSNPLFSIENTDVSFLVQLFERFRSLLCISEEQDIECQLSPNVKCSRGLTAGSPAAT